MQNLQCTGLSFRLVFVPACPPLHMLQLLYVLSKSLGHDVTSAYHRWRDIYVGDERVGSQVKCKHTKDKATFSLRLIKHCYDYINMYGALFTLSTTQTSSSSLTFTAFRDFEAELLAELVMNRYQTHLSCPCSRHPRPRPRPRHRSDLPISSLDGIQTIYDSASLPW